MSIDIVIIGINCAGTLSRCIESVLNVDLETEKMTIIYVDGGSHDASISIASEYPDVLVRHLASPNPSPGAGRNLGWQSGHSPYVLFLDADTELNPNWLNSALPRLKGEIGAVIGNRAERFPEHSVFNWIADIEWNSKDEGLIDAFGGDVMIKREVLEKTGGYNEALIAGEDPELSQRIIKAGWSILHINESMTLHDIAMTSLMKYWVRAFRTGYGYGAVYHIHGMKERHGFWSKEIKRIMIRGGMFIFLIFSSIPFLSISATVSSICMLLGCVLLCYPRLFSTSLLRKEHGLTPAQSRIYAWHCSFVVIPEFFGILRYIYGFVVGKPLLNFRGVSRKRRKFGIWVLIMITTVLMGCLHPDTGVHIPELPKEGSDEAKIESAAEMETPTKREEAVYASAEEIEAFSKTVPQSYLIGPGDVLSVIVRGRPQMGVKQAIVSPDGRISLPALGILAVDGMTIQHLTSVILKKMKELYENPDVIVQIHEYNNNKVFVLGRVAHPGMVRFGGTGTLLEALSLSGGMPTVAEEAFLTRAVIFRGKESVIWVDLTELLENGNMSHNPNLRNNDIVYIPESDDEMVYVMGEVYTPGAVRLKTDLTVLDAVMTVGGPTEDAWHSKVYLIRQKDGAGHVQNINMVSLIEKGDFSRDYVLQDGDIIFVSRHPLEEINYLIRKITPTIFWLPLVQNR